MHCIKPTSLFIVLLLLGYQQGSAQKNTLGNEEKYERAAAFDWDSLYQKVYHLSVQPQWFEDHSGMAYHTVDREGHQYLKVAFSDAGKKSCF